jgi:hypothetical protein
MRSPFRALLYSTRETLGQDLMAGNALHLCCPLCPQGVSASVTGQNRYGAKIFRVVLLREH